MRSVPGDCFFSCGGEWSGSGSQNATLSWTNPPGNVSKAALLRNKQLEDAGNSLKELTVQPQQRMRIRRSSLPHQNNNRQERLAQDFPKQRKLERAAVYLLLCSEQLALLN